MITFSRFRNGLYLSQGSLSDPSRARIGFLFQDASRTDPSFTLSASTWTEPAPQGYFAFFVPSATRDWDSFSTSLRNAFVASPPAQFGWFAETGTAVTAVTLIAVANQGTPTPSVAQAFTLTFNNIALSLQTGPFLPAGISFDDTANEFRFANPNQSSIKLDVKPVNSAQVTFTSPSPALRLPMDEAASQQAASINAGFAFATQDLATFEAGFMYFGPPHAGLLSALSFPFLRAPGGTPTALQFAAWLDVLQPLVDTRSYFQCTDATVGSYFTAATGQAFALTTVAGDVARTSRLAFANRPVRTTSDTGNYYLTPAGAFGVTLDGGASLAGPPALVCGTAGTEFLFVDVTPDAADTLMFHTGNAAYQQSAPPPSPGGWPSFLNTAGGNVTTSWGQLLTQTGQYISQPQESPLYSQPDQSVAKQQGDGGLDVYLLDFLPLPSWSAAHSTRATNAAVSATPIVPIVPFAGLSFTTADQVQPYTQMELTAINPTRKNSFSASQATASARRAASGQSRALTATADLTYAMTPQGLLAGLSGTTPNQIWDATRIAISPALETGQPGIYLQFTEMQEQIRTALQQNQIFLVISTLTNPNPPANPLFGFSGTDQQINIAGWPFSLSPTGTKSADGTPPIVLMKFYPGQSIKDLVGDTTLWSQADTFNDPAGFTADQAQTYIQTLIQQACEAVYGAGQCPDGNPAGQPDTTSLYYNFYQVVTDPAWSGLLALNCNMQLNNLPTAIKALTGGMTYPDGNGNPVSNIDAFRVHHVGVSINDTDPGSTTPTLSQSSLFGLVDYEKPASGKSASGIDIEVFYNFEVEFLRALFTNSSLSSFSCQINLTINNLFGTPVTETTPPDAGADAADDDDKNVIVITGAYQAHSTSGDDSTSGEGVYSFIAEKSFAFDFATNPYLDKITLTKLQFSFQQETPQQSADTSNIQASFGIWGALVFKEFNVLDIFSFEQLVFNDLGISVSFDLTVPAPPHSPTTSNLALAFNPGNLRLDLANSTPKEGANSLLSLLPFKLTSFLYNQYPDQQTLEDLGYFALSSVPLDPGFSLTDQFNYALTFDLDLGRLGALVGSLDAFKFSFLIGWLADQSGTAGGLAFGVQLPQADGKLQIKIEGVLNLLIEQFILRYESSTDHSSSMLVLVLHNSSIEILGQRLPPGSAQFDFALFAPLDDAARIGWITAVNNTGGGEATRAIAHRGTAAAEESGGSAFELVYLGLGQRVGPDPSSPPTNFADFLAFMTTDFWTAIEDSDYDKVYHPDSQWLALADLKLLEKIEVGFVFYDVTPFYSLTLNVVDLFNFEITYTKVSDSIGLFYANFSLPESLRTFQVGAASLTLPSIGISVYTNGNWMLDVGFPDGDDWSRCFRVQAQAGPVPVTGSGGFQLASLSSATSEIFASDYASILSFGFAVRLGVGKDFVAGPLKAGVSVTFFGIIQGAAGYNNASSNEIFQRPDALMLQGQFGVIGELYGSIDFVIIKASVNVRLQASIGIVLKWEPKAGNDGSILLYIEASVSVSVSVEINLFLFSITISFSFNASFRFDWQLAGPAQTRALLAMHETLRARRLADAAIAVLPLIPGFTPSLEIWYTPEGTVVFPSATANGVPWVVASLAAQYDPAPKPGTTYQDFLPFEKITTQLVTWAVGQALGKPGWNYAISLEELTVLDQNPQTLLFGIDYAALLAELAVFSSTTVIVPDLPPQTQVSAATFPMFPFFRLQTTGRLNGTQPDDLNYVFSELNNVPASYIDAVDAYFNQLFVNQTQGGGATLMASADGATTPLIQEIFFDYATGLIRGAVHQLLETLQDGGSGLTTIDAVIRMAVSNGQFASLSGQMSSSFRGGVRLPYTAGLTVPGGAALTTTNPLYALLWQEFPVGDLGSPGKYTIALSNADARQGWVTTSASWDVTSSWLTPLQNLPSSTVVAPSAPQQLPFTDIGPQSFAFQNAVVWTQPTGTTVSLRPFPTSLQALQATLDADIAVLVESRAAGALYLPGGTTLPPGGFVWATQVSLSVTQVPAGNGTPLQDIFALTGASQQDEQLLQQILTLLETENPIASIQVLYQSAAGASGLTSATVDAKDVFVLRTNTTTLSAPPVALFALAAPVPTQTVPVGAQIDDDAGFLQIIQQAAVTNATGYYLRYLDTSGNSLPPELFSSGPAPLTILITYQPDGSANTPSSPAQIRPFYNAIALSDMDASLVYYAETTDRTLSTQYSTVAPGSIGVVLTRDDTVMKLQPSAALRATATDLTARHYKRSELIAALIQSGVTHEASVHAQLAQSGGAAAGLNALYSLVTYQVQATSGFKLSPLSAPIQPQQPDGGSSAADGLKDASDDTRSYRIYAPLYNLALGQTSGATPNRYLGIAAPVSLQIFQNDAFGNQMPSALPFNTTNYYFDPILALDQWQGVVPAYDFGNTPNGPQPNSFTVYLAPSQTAFAGMTSDQIAAALTNWTTIYDQITSPGVSFFIETNLALQADGSLVEVSLTGQQDKIIALAGHLVAWLQDTSLPFPSAVVPLTVTVSGTGTLPPAFELVALFGIQRDTGLISPLLKDQFGTITFPAAQRVTTTVAPTVGASLPSGGSVSLSAFAAQFVTAFPALALSVGLNGGQTPSSRKTRISRKSKAARQAKALRASGVAADGSGSGQAGPQSLWAVQQVLLHISIGTGQQAGPFYVSPKPLDNALNSAAVPLPALPAALRPPQWPASQLFTDVDLDVVNAAFFSAVDLMLAPQSAAAAFALARDAYTTIANGRAQIAHLYANKEIDWLFPAASPFTGSFEQWQQAEDAFGQQMRAALATAYTTDTIVQYGVTWNGTVPSEVGDLYELYGTVQPTDGNALPRGFTLSSPHVAIPPSGGSTLTFLFGINDVKDVASATLDLSYNVTHIQHFLQPSGATPDDEARPSIWLQLVDPYAKPPHIGPDGTSTVIPLVFRQFPTPPTLVSQTAVAGLSQGTGSPITPSSNPLVAAAAWHLHYAYQVQLTPHDEILSAITYNTDLTASSGSGSKADRLTAAPVYYTLFEALARFNATYAVIQATLSNPADPNWPAAAGVFADLVTEVVTNTTWTPLPTAFSAAGGLVQVTDTYSITDVEQTDGSRLITLAWDQQESSFQGATISIEALSPALVPYPDQVAAGFPTSVTDRYTPQPPLQEDWVVHQIQVDNLDVLAAENALAAVQVERNRIEMTDATGKAWYAQGEFIYMTPVVSATQPISPFVDNATPINVATLPNQGIGSGCPQTPPPGVHSLCQRIYTMMYDLLAESAAVTSLTALRAKAGLGTGVPRRVKMACGFQYPLASAGGVVSANPVSPLTPVTLARSFLIDGNAPAQLSQLSGQYATKMAQWAASNAVTFGGGAQQGAQFVFDITLYAELSGLNTPVLRLRSLYLKTADITA